MGETYSMLVSCRNSMLVSCRNSMLELVIPIDKGKLRDQVDWDKMPCANCGTYKLDPSTIRPCAP